MSHQIENWVARIFSDLSKEKSPDFSGLGLLFYRPGFLPPTASLAPDVSSLDLPTKNFRQSAELLHQICRPVSPFHDGFHLVNADSLAITHVCQFLSPPVPDQSHPIANSQPIGARFMAAYLCSMLPSVAAAATLSKHTGGTLFIRGTTRKISPPES